MATWTIAVDFDDDGDFSEANEDITVYVVKAEWRLGMADPEQLVANPGELVLSLRNLDQRFSPEFGTYDLEPGRFIRVSSNDGTTTRIHYTGMIDRVEPLPGPFGKRSAVLVALTPDWQLRDSVVSIPPAVDVTADEVIEAVLDKVPMRRRELYQRWILGLAGYSELDVSTRLADITIPRDLDTGLSTFAYVGDLWDDGVSALQAIAQVTEAERGAFYIDREGTATFLNRQALLVGSAAATFDNSMQGLEYVYGRRVYSSVQVKVTPRRIGSVGTVLWETPRARALEPAVETRWRVLFRDDVKRAIGALQVDVPVFGTHYEINDLPDGTGESQNSDVAVWLVEASFSSAVIALRNDANEKLYVQAGFQVTGTPILIDDPVVIERTDPYALTWYGPRRLVLDLPVLDDLEQAQQLCTFYGALLQRPRGDAKLMVLDAAYHEAQILARTLFDRVTVEELQTAHEDTYLIVGERHLLDLASYKHVCSWTLAPAYTGAFWALNVSRLDLDTYVAF